MIARHWRPPSPGCAVLVGALAGLGAVSSADARQRADDGLELAFGEGCAVIDLAQVRRIARIELRARLNLQSSTARLPPVTVLCDEKQASVRVESTTGAGVRERAVPFAGTAPIARARLLALAVTELVLAPELPADPAPAPAPPPPPAGVVEPRAVTNPRGAFGVLAIGYGRSWPAGWASAGGGLAVSGWFARRGLVRVDAVVEHGSAEVAQGRAVVDSISVGAAALVAARPAGWHLGVGAGLRLGGTRLAGQSADATMARGRSFLAASGGPMATLLVAPPPFRRLIFQLSLEAGQVTMPVNGRAGTVRTFEVAGPWLGAAIGAGFAL